MTCESSLNGDLSSLNVTHLPDHDPVWVLTQEGAKNAWEVEADRLMRRDLDDAIDVILDGVFCGEQLGIDGIDAAQRGIESGCFTRASRTRDDENAVGLLDGLADILINVRWQTEVFQGKIDR